MTLWAARVESLETGKVNIKSGFPLPFAKRYGKDLYAGALVFLFGIGAISAGITYNIGSLSRMGPGFFPVAVGAILVLVGLAIAFTSKRPDVHAEAKEHLPPEWRGWICIAAGVLAFVVLGKYGGLLPATFAIVFISALGDRQNNVKDALILALGMCVICTVVFWWALQLQFPLFTWG